MTIIYRYRKIIIKTIFLFIIIRLFLFACHTIEENLVEFGYERRNKKVREKIIDRAYALLKKKPDDVVSINGKNFTMDCTGLIRAVFYAGGIDLAKDFYKYEGNGVKRIYYSLKEREALHDLKVPQIADVIFWDNTWDRNGDNVFGNDPLTHIGIVVQVDDDGTVHYIHQNYVMGVTIESMNLYNPTLFMNGEGKVINSAMYINSSFGKHPEHWLSGDLFKRFGGVLKVREYYEN